MKQAKILLGNLTITVLVAMLFDITPAEWLTFDIDAQTVTEVLGLTLTSLVSYGISDTIGWPRVWKGLANMLANLPWWFAYSVTLLADLG